MAVGEGVPASRLGQRVWVWNGQWRRPFGTAAQSIVLPAEQAVPLPADVTMEAGACLGIPAYTGYQGVTLTGASEGSTVLVAARRRRSRPLCHPVRKETRCHRDRHGELARPKPSSLDRQAPTHVIDYRRERRGRTGHGDHRQARRRCGDRGRPCGQCPAVARRACAQWHRGDLRQRRARGDDPVRSSCCRTASS